MHELESSPEGPNLAGSSAAGPTWEGRVEPHNTQTETTTSGGVKWSGIDGVKLVEWSHYFESGVLSYRLLG